jgi:hypothetical protein
MSYKAGRMAPRMEMLEDRMLLSTTVTYTPTSISIVGDATRTGTINVTGTAGGLYTVAVLGGEPVVYKGQPLPPVVSNAVCITVSTGNAGRTVNVTPANAKNVTINGGIGDDNITAGSNVFAGNVTINGGDGTNFLTVTSVDIPGNVTIKGGKDQDYITVGLATVIGGNTIINAGDGSNRVLVAGAVIRGNFVINGGKDADLVVLGHISATGLLGNCSIDTKAGGDIILFNQGTYGSSGFGKVTTFKAMAGDGDDNIAIGGIWYAGAVVFGGTFSLDAGAGSDTLQFANATLAAEVDFEKAATFRMGAGDDVVQISNIGNPNLVIFRGNTTIDMGLSLTGGLGDRIGVGVGSTSLLIFQGAKNTINLGAGIKGLVTGIRASSILLGGSTHTEIKAAKGASVSSTLKSAIFKGIDVTFDNVGVTLSLGEA